MSQDEELPRKAAQSLVPADLTSAGLPYPVPGLAPRARVRWGRATALQLVAGGIAGFVGPIILFSGGPPLGSFSFSNQVILIFIYLLSGVVVALLGAGIPLLIAWLSWLIVSRREPRRLRSEVLAVVLGAVGGSLIPSAFPIFIMAVSESTWPEFAVPVLLLGGVPALAFALWVVAAWRPVRKAAASAVS